MRAVSTSLGAALTPMAIAAERARIENCMFLEIGFAGEDWYVVCVVLESSSELLKLY